MKKVLMALVMVVVLCVSFTGIAAAQEPGMSYHQSSSMFGDIEGTWQFSNHTNNGAWEVLCIDGDSGWVEMDLAIEMGPILCENPDGTMEQIGGEIEKNELISLGAILSPIDLIETTYLCTPPKETDLTAQVSAVGITASTPEGATMHKHVEAMEIGGGPAPVVGQVYVETLDLINYGGVTMRFIDISGKWARGRVSADWVVAGAITHFDAVALIDLPPPIKPWWMGCPPGVVCPTP